MREGTDIELYEDVATLKANVKAIMENHLPHLQKELESQSNKLNWGVFLLITNLVGLVFALLQKVL